MRKAATILIAAVIIIFLAQFPIRYYSSRSIRFRTAGTMFQIYKNGEWQDFLIKGVNMGASKPGCFPGDIGIEKDEYKRWFKQIAEMNANSVRVYTILSPGFYEALFEYNMFAKKPLYLFHGVWNNENAVSKWQDGFRPEISDDYRSEIADLIDLLHGKKTIAPKPGRASGAYIWDVSSYVAGYILGIEQNTAFVINTNKNNSQVKRYDGDFLYTVDASPYECWLAEIGDYAINYEYSAYKTQKTLSWTNWITTDPIWHLSDPDRGQEDAVSVDIEHIRKKDSFGAGLFASYHIYPYYPEFMMFDPEYTSYIDRKGKVNPYEAYLNDIRSHHSIPLLVAEFGIPTSRGRTHENAVTGYNQGFVAEAEAGEYIADMFDSIVTSGCAGGLVFAWHDEWSKRSWNTMDYDLSDRRPFWSNAQVSEQGYGIMTFDPGKNKSVCYVDGNTAEWKRIRPLAAKNDLALSAMSDEKYVYFMIQDKKINSGDKYAIAVSGLKDQGNYRFEKENLTFSNPASQCIIIDGTENSAIYVDAYYDTFYRQYSIIRRLGIVQRNPAFEEKNSGIFNPIHLMLRRSLYFPLTGEELPPSVYETGKLLHGNANPESENYSSLADFCINGENSSIELRIPWQLLNVADPSTKMVIGDLYAHEEFNINPVRIDGFNFELYKTTGGNITGGGSGFYSWKPWEKVNYHERLKKSYETIKNNFGGY